MLEEIAPIHDDAMASIRFPVTDGFPPQRASNAELRCFFLLSVRTRCGVTVIHTNCCWWVRWKQRSCWTRAGPLLNIKTVFPRYGDSHARDKTIVRPWDRLAHPAVRDKRRVSEIDSSQPRHGTAFCWRHNGPVTSQLTDQIMWPNHLFELRSGFMCI